MWAGHKNEKAQSMKTWLSIFKMEQEETYPEDDGLSTRERMAMKYNERMGKAGEQKEPSRPVTATVCSSLMHEPLHGSP